MALTHLPTRLRSYSDQPLGFVSAAEGFVFLSAFVAGQSYSALLPARGVQQMRSRLWARARKVYGYHLALLLFAFTVVAAIALSTGRPGLKNLLAFYFESPGTALVSSLVLLYQPPLFDILPMYVIFLALSPFILEFVEHCGWSRLLAGSVLVWGFAQLGGRGLLHAAFCAVTGLSLPLNAAGSFDLLAWQVLWVGGLWSASSSEQRSAPGLSRGWIGTAALVSLGFLVWRHRVGGFWIDLGALHAGLLDKWHLGCLRMVNFAALAVVVSHLFLPALRWVSVSGLALLGRASLQVFAAHLLLCLVSLGLVVDDETPLGSAEEMAVLLLTFGAMLLVAWLASRSRGGRYRLAR
jgi:hypothetical protein